MNINTESINEYIEAMYLDGLSSLLKIFQPYTKTDDSRTVATSITIALALICGDIFFTFKGGLIDSDNIDSILNYFELAIKNRLTELENIKK